MSGGGERVRRASALSSLDRRWVHAALAVAILLSIVAHVRFPDTPSPLVEGLYDRVESLPPGSPIVLSLDYSPNSRPELEPMATALIRHALLRGQRLILLSVWDTGNAMIEDLENDVLKVDFPDRREGTAWVALGYKTGNEILINAIRDNFGAMYRTDLRDSLLTSLPTLAGVRGLSDCGLIVSLSGGSPGLKEWILFAGDVTRVPVAGGCTGVGTPEFLPYFPRQLIGLLGGLKGAAEYEAALERGHPEYHQRTMAATDGMGPQSVAHTVIIIFILLGNAGYLIDRHRRRRESA
ncbi:MAG: hypothetical protein ACYDIE_11410 [Candidatus Krumholzibacteriia bacterium]